MEFIIFDFKLWIMILRCCYDNCWNSIFDCYNNSDKGSVEIIYLNIIITSVQKYDPSYLPIYYVCQLTCVHCLVKVQNQYQFFCFKNTFYALFFSCKANIGRTEVTLSILNGANSLIHVKYWFFPFLFLLLSFFPFSFSFFHKKVFAPQ